MSFDGMKAWEAIHFPKDLDLWAGYELHKSQDCQGNSNQDRVDGADRNYPQCGQGRQSEFSPVNLVDHLQPFEVHQGKCRLHQYGTQSGNGDIPQRSGKEQEHQGDRASSNEPGDLGATARCIAHSRSRIGAAYREAVRGTGWGNCNFLQPENSNAEARGRDWGFAPCR